MYSMKGDEITIYSTCASLHVLLSHSGDFISAKGEKGNLNFQNRILKSDSSKREAIKQHIDVANRRLNTEHYSHWY